MKIKSIVLTAALATAFSAFSDSVNVDWFTTNATGVVYFDRNINDPVVVTNSVAEPAGFTVAAYAVTAYVTNLVVFAEKPAVGSLKSGAKGAICAAYDSTSSTNKWYGLYYDNDVATWAKLTNLTTDPAENSSYALRMEFKEESSVAKVRYSVNGTNGLTENDGWLASTGSYAQPNLYAFAGMGGCTNIVGELVITASGTAVEVSGGKILIDTSVLPEEQVNVDGANGLKKWVNYVLGIDAPTATSKPYAAPVQNASANTLTFKLGGVGTVRGQDTTGAKVTYTVEELESLTATSANQTELNNNTNGYVGPNDSVSVDLSSEAVKYYRIKIKIDPAH